MASLFWGVGDALDLYGEYVDAKKQKMNTVCPSSECVLQKDSDMKDSSGVAPDPDVSKDSIESSEKKDSEKSVNGTANGDDHGLSCLNSHPAKNQDISNEITDKKVQSSDCMEETKQVVENYDETLTDKGKKDSHIQIQDVENCKEQNDNLKEENYFLNLAVDISDNVCSEIGAVEESTCDTDLKVNSPVDVKNPGIAISGDSIKDSDVDNNVRSMEHETNFSPEPVEEPPQNVLNILLYGAGDPRHIIKTIAKRYKYFENESTASNVPLLKFYVLEGCMEIVARNIGLLGIALERPELISLRNKVHLFMDVYGNTFLRPTCHQYLVSKSATLLKMVSDKDVLAKIAPFIHIDELKYREIDALQDTFEFWQPKPGYEFNIKEFWMCRLRRLLAVRYDARDGVFDWDLNMSLKDRGCEQICSQEYRYWRETGIAFTFPEYEQCKPNKTLATGLVRHGSRFLHRGYIGDIQTGPFCTFGLRSSEQRMHYSAHGENDYRATDITERNLLEFFHEIQTGTGYVHNNSLSNKYGSVRFQMGERLIYNEYDMTGITAYDKPWISVEGVEVHFLPLLEVKEIAKGASKWEEFFDVAFIGYKYFDLLSDEFTKVMRENSLLIFETKLRSVEIKSRVVEFAAELQEYAKQAKLLGVLNYHALNSNNSILKFWKPEKSVQDSMKTDY